MKTHSQRRIHLAPAILVFVATSMPLFAQTTEDLIRQLCGKAEAPARDATQLAEAYQKAVDSLLPLMSADDVRSRAASDRGPAPPLVLRCCEPCRVCLSAGAGSRTVDRRRA